MLVHVHLDVRQAIISGKVESGNYSLDLSEEDLAQLNGPERIELADIRGVGCLPNFFSTRLQVESLDVRGIKKALQVAIAERAKKETELARIASERAAIAESWMASHSPEDLVVQYKDGKFTYWRLSYQQELEIKDSVSEDHPVIPLIKSYVEQAKKIALERNNAELEERKRLDEAIEKKRTEEREAYDASRLAWIAQYGSKRLKTLVAEDIGFNKTYQEERLSIERPGWKFFSEVCGEVVGIRDATESDLDVLEATRRIDPEARLGWLTYADCKCHSEDREMEDYTGNPIFKSRPVVTAIFLGRTIIFDFMNEVR